MIPNMAVIENLLERPTYDFGQVDFVLGLKPGTAARWIDGYERSGKHYDPVVRAETTGRERVTWGEFVEVRMLAEYRTSGVTMLRMRPAVMRLRQEFGDYPLASAKMWLGHDSRDLVRAVQDEVKLDNQLAIVEVIKTGDAMLPGISKVQWTDRARQFRDSLIFTDDAQGTKVVSLIRPMAGNNDVVIDPLRGFGNPVVRNVRTEILAELYRAGDPPEMIAELYDLKVSEVNAAVRYEFARLKGQRESAA